jgi:hypothetical protein
MMTDAEIKRAETAKTKLIEAYGRQAWFRGAGIAPNTRSKLKLRLNVAPEKIRTIASALPSRFEGFPLEVIGIEYSVRQTRK